MSAPEGKQIYELGGVSVWEHPHGYRKAYTYIKGKYENFAEVPFASLFLNLSVVNCVKKFVHFVDNTQYQNDIDRYGKQRDYLKRWLHLTCE